MITDDHSDANGIRKKPRGDAAGLRSENYEEEDPSFAGLAATYSAKSWDLVPSALGSLTAEFGMGSGSGSPLEPPGRRKTDQESVISDQ
jgi:hypothetical protein